MSYNLEERASDRPRTGAFPVGQMTDLADIDRAMAPRECQMRAAMPAARWAKNPVPSFDDLVGAGEDRLRDGEAERLGGLEIHDQLECGWLLHRQIGGLSTFEDLSDVSTDIAIGVGQVRSIADQAAGRGVF